MESDPALDPLLAAPSSSPFLLDTLFLVFLRAIYFLLSRRFLLSTLNPTLRDLSKPETLLPPTATSETCTGRPRHDGRPSLLPALPTDVDLDGELDTEDDLRDTPSSSYPPSPSSKSMGSNASSAHSNRDPFLRRTTDEVSKQAKNLAKTSEVGTDQIELQTLAQRLKDVGANAGRRIQVLELSHGRRDGSGGTKGVKKATRGLSRLARVLFSLCVAESCILITLVMFHALGILHSRSRHVNFSVSLHIILAVILLVVPLVQCMLLTYRSRDSSSLSTAPSRIASIPFFSRILIALIPFGLYCFLFTRIPPYVTAIPSSSFMPDSSTLADLGSAPTPSSSSSIDDAIVNWSTSGPEGWEGGGWLALSLGRVVVLGVVVLGGLSGFGAVRTAWDFFEHLSGAGSRALTDGNILQAERSLYRVRHDLVAKRDELASLGSADPSSASGGGWMDKVFGGGGNSDMASVQAELRGLEAIERQVSRSLLAMKSRKSRQEFSGTFRGKLYSIMGYVFALYCAARLLMCIPSIFFTPLATSEIPTEDTAEIHVTGNTNGDWISFLLALGLSHIPTGVIDIDVAVWSRAISLLLTGLLILSSLARVLRSLSRILRLTSKTVGAGFLLLSLGQLFSTYVISLLVQLRTSLPPSPTTDTDPFSPFYANVTIMAGGTATPLPHETTEDSLLASLPDFRVFGRLFDVMFLLAATGTGLYRYVAMKVNPADDGGEIYEH